MDWKEATGDANLLGLVTKDEQGSESSSRKRWKIKESVSLNYESVWVDSSYSAGNPVKVDATGGDVDIYQLQPGEL